MSVPGRTERDIIDSVQADLCLAVAVVHGTRFALVHPDSVTTTLADALRHVEDMLQCAISDVAELVDHRNKRVGTG